jgi:hypothetical protein
MYHVVGSVENAFRGLHLFSCNSVFPFYAARACEARFDHESACGENIAELAKTPENRDRNHVSTNC